MTYEEYRRELNEALEKAEEMVQTEMAKVTGGMNLGGLF